MFGWATPEQGKIPVFVKKKVRNLSNFITQRMRRFLRGNKSLKWWVSLDTLQLVRDWVHYCPFAALAHAFRASLCRTHHFCCHLLPSTCRRPSHWHACGWYVIGLRRNTLGCTGEWWSAVSTIIAWWLLTWLNRPIVGSIQQQWLLIWSWVNGCDFGGLSTQDTKRVCPGLGV